MIERQKAIQIFTSAIEAVQPQRLIQQHLKITKDVLSICDEVFSLNKNRHIYMIGAGKAAAALAVATGNILSGYITKGLVTTKCQHSLPSTKIRIREAAHPAPDGSSVQAVNETIELIK